MLLSPLEAEALALISAARAKANRGVADRSGVARAWMASGASAFDLAQIGGVRLRICHHRL